MNLAVKNTRPSAFENVRTVLAQIRPAMRADGGDVELVDITNNIVYVRLKGACLDCPSAPMTMRHGIEATLKRELAWVERVERVHDTTDALPDNNEFSMMKTIRSLPVLKTIMVWLFVMATVAGGCKKESTPNTVSGATSQSSASARPAGGQDNRVKLRIGLQNSAAMALAMVAKDSGAFDRNGIDASIETFTAGKFALTAFFGGSLDVVISGEVPVGLATLAGNKLKVVSQVVDSTSNECRIVVLRDGSESTPKQYFGAKRRKLATSFGGGPEFFSYDFLRKNNIAIDQVELVALQPSEMVPALSNGSVDGISIFDPFCYIAEKRLGGKVKSFTAGPDVYSQFYIASVSEKMDAERPEVVQRFVQALADAEKFIAENPAGAKKIVAGYTKLEPDVIDGIWGNFKFRAVLTDQLIDTWKRQVTWAKETKKAPADAIVPNFGSIVDRRFVDGIKR